jgi:hypothetical protein
VQDIGQAGTSRCARCFDDAIAIHGISWFNDPGGDSLDIKTQLMDT